MSKTWSLRVTSVLGSFLLTAGVLAGVTFGTSSVAAAASGTFVCSGASLESPGVLSGSYNDVLVQGVCVVPAGPAMVKGSVTVAPGGALIAAFAGGQLTVQKDVDVSTGGTAILGCFASSFACLDDPNQDSPTLNSPVFIKRDLSAVGALGVIVHDGTIGRDVTESGGGGGVTCDPTGFFASIGQPAYSDFEDSSVGRDMSVTGLQSCWFGALRVNVGRDLTYANNTFADPDASEVHTNVVGRDMSCSGNNPAVQYGDAAGGGPNQVGRNAVGECAFNVSLPNPVPDGPLTPISIRG
jgi:hypothetical protein